MVDEGRGRRRTQLGLSSLPRGKKEKVGVQGDAPCRSHGGGMRELGSLSRSRAGLLLLLLIPPLLLALQLLVVARLWVEERDGAVAFTVISIEPERRSADKAEEGRSSRARMEEEEDLMRVVERAYDENEMHERQVRLV